MHIGILIFLFQKELLDYDKIFQQFFLLKYRRHGTFLITQVKHVVPMVRQMAL